LPKSLIYQTALPCGNAKSERVMPPDALAVHQFLMGDSGPPRSGDWGRTPFSADWFTKTLLAQPLVEKRRFRTACVSPT